MKTARDYLEMDGLELLMQDPYDVQRSILANAKETIDEICEAKVGQTYCTTPILEPAARTQEESQE